MKHRRLLLALPLSFALYGSMTDPAWAQVENPSQYPVISLARLTLGARGEYSWLSNVNDNDPQPPFKKEWAVGIVGAYGLVPKLSAIGGVTYGVDNREYRSWLGVSLKIFDGQALYGR
jgi:hypothetical protein